MSATESFKNTLVASTRLFLFPITNPSTEFNAKKAITKLASVEIRLSTVLSSNAGKKLPVDSKKKAKEAMKEVEKIMKDARHALMGNPFPHKADDVKATMDRAIAQMQVLEMIIASGG